MEIKKQNKTTNSKCLNDNNAEIDQICAEVLHAVNSVGYPPAAYQMNDSKEEIYTLVMQKIHAETFSGRQKKTLFRNICAAVIALLIIGAAAYSAYRLGRDSGSLLSQSEIEVCAPYGVLTKVTLPDGSHATLNGGSKLKYPAVFTGAREVCLSGEVFFDIVKDKTPFTVKTAQMSVNVLGTRFDLKAYDDEPFTVITLEEGRIKAIPSASTTDDGLLLEPAQQLILNNETGEIRRISVDAREYISWKDGILTFKDLTLGEIAVVLERRFDVSIRVVSTMIRNDRYVAQFKHGENIEQILDKLSYKRGWKYAKRNNEIEITEYKPK